MALVPIRIDRTSKPPMGTPLRSDGHWSVQGLVGAWAFNEGAGKTCYNNVSTKPGVPNNPYYVESTGVGIHLYSGHDGIVFPAAKFPIGISPYTLFASIKRESVGVNYGVMGYGSYSPAFCIEDTTGKPYVYHGGAKAKSNTGLAINVAGSVAYTRYNCSTGGLTYFVDGLPTGSATHSESIPAPNALALFSDRAESGGQALKGYGHFVCMYCIALTPSQIASLSANPWQIYEPELVWIEVPDGVGGSNYSESLSALAESYASVTGIATFVDAATALITAGVDASSTVTMAEAVLSTAQAADTVSDMVQRVESLLSVVQAADTVADAQAMAESLVSEITASVSVADSLNNSSTESLATEIAAASTVQDVVTILEQVHTTLEAQATVVDEQTSGAAENLVTSATAITSATDLQLMVDNVTVMAQSGASIGEIGSYLEQIATAATAGASVTDTIVGAFTYYSDYICRLPSEQRICRLPSEQRIIAIPSERRICRLTRSSL